MNQKTNFSCHIRLLIFSFALLLVATTVGPVSGGRAAADIAASSAVWTKMDSALQQMMATSSGEAIPIIVQKSATDEQAEAFEQSMQEMVRQYGLTKQQYKEAVAALLLDRDEMLAIYEHKAFGGSE